MMFDDFYYSPTFSFSVEQSGSDRECEHVDVCYIQEGGGDTPADPAALRARLKHRVAPPTTNSSTANTTTTAYDRVLDTARRLAELESQRSQDQIYIRTLEQTRATLMRDAQSAARARAEAERAMAGERDARRRREGAEVARDEAVRVVGVERARAERAEGRVGEVENRLRVCEERVGELEDALEGERKRREEWESGLEALV
jgi:chromosome segregation ATPase